MASSPESVAVLDQHRQLQARLAAGTMRTAILAWPTLIRERDEARWLALMLSVIRRDRGASAALARNYFTAYRVLERVPGTFDPELPADPPDDQLITSMIVTGPRALQAATDRAGGALAPTDARKIMESNARAAQRHVLNGARGVVDDILQRDPATSGYMRLTDGDPCYFCAMLASRGPVYKDDSFDDSDPRFSGAGDQKVHDGCGCSLVPIYGSGQVALTQWKKYERLWQASTKGTSGAAAVKAFRSAYSSPR